ncbi:uncharacterized protein LOC122509231 [Leptopilina heterotoma]|uniref:uncharacterized protein LOC122509231 n=1 Tax=Leptopilina heterotoma TaxID=63436 RepID=UPI001CA80ACB|nr:uncharacterized protein LOC122509231 [Leptopilina heterotoma]
MKLYLHLCGLLLTTVCISSKELKDKYALPNNLKLQMVNAIFRHGDRTPQTIYGESYPNDPFINETYFPMGYGGMTNMGKLRSFELGTFLRKRYNKFLGNTYIPEDITARSTYMDRAQMTLLLVLAALYPPDALQKWHSTLNWQPIPIDFKNLDDDVLLFPTRCPKYKKMFNEILQLAEVKQIFEKYKPLLKNLTELTGKNFPSPIYSFSFSNVLISQKSMNFSIPKWADEIMSNKDFQEAVELFEKLRNYNDTMKKMNGGRLLKQMTNDMIDKRTGKLKQGKKIKLYSTHDLNVSGHLYALGISKFDRPFFCNTVILELYSDANDNYYVQIIYYLGDSNKVKILEIPNCSSPCEFSRYQELIKNVIPNEDELECCDNGLEHFEIIKMKLYLHLCGLLLTTVCISSKELEDKYALPNNLNLQMVNVVFRHGDRTPLTLNGETYPKDPFINETYFPTGHGALTNVGKLRAFELGKFLRGRYNEFLGNTYIAEDITARSTYMKRAQMTLLLVLAALYPPDALQKWHSTLNWQPIPIDFKNLDDDVLLFPTRCPKYKKMFNEILQLAEVKRSFEKYKPLINNLTELTGITFRTPLYSFPFYNLLVSQKSMNLSIPKWAEEIMSNKDFQEAVDLFEKFRNYNDTLKKMNGGRLLKQMTNDMIDKKTGKLKQGKKIKLYSTHDYNMSGHLYALGISKFDRPFFCSAIILELYSDANDNYYVQIVYYQGDSNKLKILEIPNCSSLCEFSRYLELIKNVIPNEDELECCDNGLEHCSLA